MVSKNLQHKVSIYGSFQHVHRESYYGGGGRVLAPGDSITEADIIAINAYGNSKDISAVGGLQYNYDISKKLNLIAGVEYIFNEVVDEFRVLRLIDQRSGRWVRTCNCNKGPSNG